MKLITKQIKENTFSFPHWSKIDKTYSGAVLKVLAEIQKTRAFYNWCEGQISEKILQETPEKAQAMKKLTDKKGMIEIEVQLGHKWKGQSVEAVRKLYTEDEFGLGAYELGCILLAKPEILQKYEDLWLDCPGDTFDSPDSDQRFDLAPCFGFFVGELRFGTRFVAYAVEDYGSASGFFPQAKLASRNLEPLDPLMLSRVKILEDKLERIGKILNE